MRPRSLWVIAVVMISVGATMFGAVAADAETPPSAPGVAPGSALVRVAHLSPDTAGVDVYVDGQRALGNVDYRTVSNYETVPAGRHLLELRQAGAPADAKPILRATRTLVSQQAYTVAGVGLKADLRGQVFSDDLSSPAADTARVRVLHAAVGVAKVDVDLVGGPSLGTGIAFASAGPYTTVTPGASVLRIRDHADGRTLLMVPDLQFGAGIVYSVAVIGPTADQLAILPLVDARGVEVLPAGAVRTGAGGLAAPVRSSNSLPVWPLAYAIGGALAVIAVISGRRRRAA